MNPEASTPAKIKMRRLIGRPKSPKKPPKTATKAQAPAATDLLETLQASVVEIVAQVPAIGLDGDAGAPTEQIGELVKPVRAGGKAKAKMPKSAPLSVRLDR